MRVLPIVLALLLFSCAEKKPKEKQKRRYKSEVAQKPTAKKNTSLIIDLESTGIGPVKDLSLPEKIDDEMARMGSELFRQKCVACHKTNKRFIGPAMESIYKRRNPAWVMNIMLNPTEMLEKDTIAKKLLEEYNNAIMLNQNLTYDEARALAEFFRTL